MQILQYKKQYVNIFLIIIFIFVSLQIHIIIHEIGHIVFYDYNNYKFISIEIGFLYGRVDFKVINSVIRSRIIGILGGPIFGFCYSLLLLKFIKYNKVFIIYFLVSWFFEFIYILGAMFSDYKDSTNIFSILFHDWMIVLRYYSNIYYLVVIIMIISFCFIVKKIKQNIFIF